MPTSSHASTAQAACEVQTIVELHTLKIIDSATPEHSPLKIESDPVLIFRIILEKEKIAL